MDEINRLKSHTPQHVQKHLDHSEKVRAERVVETFKRAVAAKGKEASKPEAPSKPETETSVTQACAPRSLSSASTV